MYLLWNLPFFKMVPAETNFFSFLKHWADNSSINQYSYQVFSLWGMTTSCHPISKMHIVGDGPGKTPSTLRCLSYLINSFITDIKHPAKDWQRGTLSAPSWCLCQKLSLSLLYFSKTLLHKSSEWSSLVSGLGLNSSPLEAKNPSVFCGSATTFQ